MSTRLLYICTHNSCRSIIAEVVTNKLAQGRLHASSAGSHPSGKVHTLTIQFLQELGYSCDNVQSQSWNDYEHYEANAVLTMCDQAATETCPIWVKNTPVVHWGLADPSQSAGDENQVRADFHNTIAEIASRVKRLLSSNFEKANDQQLAQILRSLV